MRIMIIDTMRLLVVLVGVDKARRTLGQLRVQ